MEKLCIACQGCKEKWGALASKELVSETGKETITKWCGKCYNHAKYNTFGEHEEKNVALNSYS